ncbi:hypothetical protein [uncultured Desulfobacter sp.]|uniref:hypothetical protein n=1 Tax=uncultured Desulfobacter sp. TaxID=240139 RepID=UPI002AAAC1DE|nr:hypothetical protein [uncultured Desulfobacter sp.]
MRITDPQVIENGEKDLIASVQRDLDLDAVRDLLKDRLAATVLSPKGGQIVVHDNDVAFRLDYEINLNGSLLFNRNGDLIEVTDNKPWEQEPNDEDEALESDLNHDLQDTENQNTDNHDNEIQDAEPALDEMEDLENEPAFDQDDLDILKADDDELIDGLPQDNDVENISTDEIPDIAFNDEDEDEDRDTSQDMGDDDISTILQESRDFWEKKKE